MSRKKSFLAAFLLLMFATSLAIAQESTPAYDITGVAWSSDGLYLAVANTSGHVTCWDFSTRKPVWAWQGSSHGIITIAFDSQRHSFLVLERFGHAILLSEKEGQVALDLELDFGERDGRYVAGLSSGAFDDASETLALSGNIIPVVHVVNFRAIPNTPIKQTVALGSTYWRHPPFVKGVEKTSLVMSIKRTNASGIADLSVGATDDDTLTDLAICPGGNEAIGVTNAGWLVGWDLKSLGGDKTKYRRHVIERSHDSNYLLDVRCGPNAQVVSTGTTEKYGTIQLWDGNEGVLSFSKDTDAHSLIEHGAVFSPDGSQLVTNGDLSYIWWEIQSSKLKEVAVLYHSGSGAPNELRSNFAFRPNGNVVALSEGTVLILVNIAKKDVSCFADDCGKELPKLRMVDDGASAQKPLGNLY